MAFEDVVADVIAYLGPLMSPLTVVSEVPRDRPDEFIQVRRIGGTAVMPVREIVRLDVWAWAEEGEEQRAMQLIATVRAHIWALRHSTTLGYQCYDIGETMGPTQASDLDTGLPRGWYRPELTVRANDVVPH